MSFPQGVACADFPLRLQGFDDQPVSRQFIDRSGRVRLLVAGRAPSTTLTNLTSGEQYVVPGRAATIWTTIKPDGTQRFDISGTVTLILFPTDIPAGPSTTAITGRLVFTVDTQGVFRLVSVKGQQTDICAALADD